ncbi:hypothetical protein BSKO_01136 [Bryopsis sp. KO-2023]|nr:hypothetical protein BSKO_01136 [Bryopsis sp. KO-2023]
MSGTSGGWLRCQLCGKPCGSEFACPECQAIPYCSVKHRRAHFETHQENCARLKSQLLRSKDLGDFPFPFSTLLTDRSQFGAKPLCEFLASHGCHGSSLWARACPLHKSDQRFGDIGAKRMIVKAEDHGKDGKKRRAIFMEDKETGGVSKIAKRDASSRIAPKAVESTGETEGAVVPSVLDGSQNHRSIPPPEGDVSDMPCKPDNKGSFILKSTASVRDLWGLPENEIPTIGDSVPDSFHINSWLACYQFFGVGTSSPAALLLHFPLTLFLGISLAGIPKCRPLIRVHYLGPQDELDMLEVFGVLMDLLPGTRIHIDFIGPDISKELDGRQLEILPTTKSMCEKTPWPCSWDDLELIDYQDIDMVCPPPPFTNEKCKPRELTTHQSNPEIDISHQRIEKKIGAMTMSFWRGVYHDWLNNSSGLHEESKQADLVFAPNAGLEAYPSWLPTIEMLSQTGPFALFTDYGEEAIVRPAKMLKSWGLNVGGAFVNPFRQPLLRVDSGNVLPCYSNGFGFVMNDGS